jgi:hypothetical protein
MYRSSLILLSILVFTSTQYAQGDPIVSVTGGDDGWIVIYSGQAFAVSWSQENLTLDTAISARLSSNGRAGEEGIAFLSNALGPGTSMDALVASADFIFPTAPSDFTLFADLDLPAGTYYLSIIGKSPSWGSSWMSASEPILETAPGVVLGPTFGFQTRETFLPASEVWSDGTSSPNFSVTTSVPEPGVASFILCGGVLALRSKRRRAGV